jgi:hypothetical protein
MILEIAYAETIGDALRYIKYSYLCRNTYGALVLNQTGIFSTNLHTKKSTNAVSIAVTNPVSILSRMYIHRYKTN